MSALIRFVDVRSTTSNRIFSFVMHSGELRVLRFVSRSEKNTMIDTVVGVVDVEIGSIELVQGERRRNNALVDPLKERRKEKKLLSEIWCLLSAGRVGWVSANGGLISNLKVWENITLPLWYHHKHDVEETELTIIQYLGVLGLAQDMYEEFMAALPDNIEIWQRKLAGMLRALLLKPRVLVVDEALFDDVNERIKLCWIKALEAYASHGNAVLVMSDKVTTLPWKIID